MKSLELRAHSEYRKWKKKIKKEKALAQQNRIEEPKKDSKSVKQKWKDYLSKSNKLYE